MTAFELGILVAQRRNVPGHLKQAYADGFAGALEKRAQEVPSNTEAILSLIGEHARNIGKDIRWHAKSPWPLPIRRSVSGGPSQIRSTSDAIGRYGPAAATATALAALSAYVRHKQKKNEEAQQNAAPYLRSLRSLER